MQRTEEFGKEKNDKLYIPHEIINQEILSRLSVKNIFRFKSVSKLWYFLGNDSKFVEKHLDRSRNAPSLVVLSYKNEEDVSIISFNSLRVAENGNKTQLMFTVPLHLDIYVMEPSYHDLVCFSALLRQEIYVCNPGTHEFMQLPRVLTGLSIFAL
ncbi:hypothetical protein IFM89_018277 [Coptis chinensis]|uniref:F-box domain-containing protein n=1 Tax=Coptis chinensis TaxID=261450 RepID=A0A835LZT3_9MAGN|nr:hypothetical protein IFM89_018277 [Coptis chinensis]